jgi:hypothetical protein
MQFPRRANKELIAANSELNRTDHEDKSRLRELPIVDFQALAPERLPDVSIPSSAPRFQLDRGLFGRSAAGGLTPEIWHQSGAVRQVVISTRRLR